MSAQSLYRLTAAGLMVGAILFAVGFPLSVFPPEVAVLPQVLVIAFAMLLMAGIVGLYLRQREETGVLGLIGAALVFVGAVLATSGNFVFALVVPGLAETAPDVLQRFPEGEWRTFLAVNVIARMVLGLGFVLFGIATYRARVLPRWAAVLATLGAIGTPFVPFLPLLVGKAVVLLLPLGLFGLGWGLWSRASETPRAIEAGDGTGHRRTALVG